MRISLGVEYNGTNYHGWQKQPGLITIQQQAEDALSYVADHKVEIVCAGRTDVGVHALGQVIHFDTEVTREIKSWIMGGNSNLPPDIRIKWAKEVGEDFHARFSANARRYRYLIYNATISSAIYHNLVTWHYHELDEKLMHEAGQYLIGEHDFSSFRGCDCQSKTPMRNVQELQVKRYNNLIIIDIKANAFLQHMVRNIVGLLILIGENKKPTTWAQEVLKACDRRVAATTAPAHGLYFMRAYYES